MSPRVVIVDTNVLVAGLLTFDSASPTARILDGMLRGHFLFFLSSELVTEYRNVLLRPAIVKRHRLSEDEVDEILVRIAENGILREPSSVLEGAPDPGDGHLWSLLGCEPGALLITGDRPLLEDPPRPGSIVSPRTFIEMTAEA